MSGFHRPGSHCLHQARSAVRCSASRRKGELHPTQNRLSRRWGGGEKATSDRSMELSTRCCQSQHSWSLCVPPLFLRKSAFKIVPRGMLYWFYTVGKGGRYSFVACLGHLAVDYAFLSRRRTVPTPDRHLQRLGAQYVSSLQCKNFFVYLISFLFGRYLKVRQKCSHEEPYPSSAERRLTNVVSAAQRKTSLARHSTRRSHVRGLSCTSSLKR